MKIPANFLNLPGELRNKIYGHLLVRNEIINPWQRNYDLAPNLLSTSKKIQHETSTLLYGNNCFDLTGCDFELISGFFDKIGCDNMTKLRSIYIDFPIIRNFEDNISLDKNSSDIITRIEKHCTNLRTLKTCPIRTNNMGLNSFDNPSITAKAFRLVDARFRAISSLDKIIVEVFEDEPTFETRITMENQGWTVHVVERVEQWDSGSSFGCYEDWDDNYGYYDYDIDNDSDFWRRAAD
ncbi:hypothetical protein BJX99DRAFT_270834 [Aspergillus californicus]